MRIPPLYHQPLWQRFFAGFAIGGFISWFLFFYMYGGMQEKQIQMISNQEETIKDLEKKLGVLEEDYKALNKQNEEKLLVQDISVAIENYKLYQLDRLSVMEAQESIKDDLDFLITKDIESVYAGKVLLKKSIENKIIEINKKRYKIEVTEMMFYTKVSIQVKIRRI
ncbi:sporulation membrane protein YtrI [Peribacillus alkalitolerans]|uniref:sporulation membrane protein YtrI n=1 Tax=Peribacillus alkalitolerans TaxID=1550385 RepID=UPI0013D3B65F|nr:sporulation membrane protein YtrI [Peribacillus alkalitolerans]